MVEFRWNAWNLDHVGEHGIGPSEAEYVVTRAQPPFPEKSGPGKYIVKGQTDSGRYIQVVFVLDPDGTLYVIHSRPLDDQEKRRLCRRRR